ncbi:MAG: rod shape-determining protein RodA [Candidatus Muproteobacteria bacterium RBG_16_65_31]|uniref:Peptidoglycan glycosyltransferase MrdB n=1 Tax=Candidatus Muproteobacteria bacterium RBG_16_65_31 TaxID=1817759 RepID=A0A1F6TC77_9PROT|nr:MAG: rod shape-determining protein RodA [Candidatus Muproteobacteria bacterium RBG_16_65_31]
MNLQRLHLDKTLFYALLLLAFLSLVIIYSASGKNISITGAHLVRLALGFGAMLLIARVRPESLQRWSPYIFGAGLLLLLIVLGVGVIGKGAQRWLSLGLFRFQPSEILKVGVPMMLAWYFARGDLPPSLPRIAVAAVIMLVPTLMIARQPDLGTAVLVLCSGVFTLFLAGMRWRVIIPVLGLVAAAAPLVWGGLREYQRNRIQTLIDPAADPLGSGYHTIQSMIAVGSGGLYGKGWLNSSQAHLEYLPESHTDFIFAVFAEEFGLIGVLLILALYVFISLRGMMIALYAQDSYARLLAGSLSLVFFLSFFVNVGMVTGILPVVGVPLPMMSYGGSSIVALMAVFGVLMSIQTHRRIVEQ